MYYQGILFLTSSPEFLLAIPIILLLLRCKRYLDIKQKNNVLKYIIAFVCMYVSGTIIRSISQNFLFTFITQTLAFTLVFKFIYFRDKSYWFVAYGILKYLVIQIFIEMMFVGNLMIFNGDTIDELNNNPLLRLYYSMPVRLSQLIVLITFYRIRKAESLEEYKDVKKICYIVESLLVTSEILILNVFLSMGSKLLLSQKIVFVVILVIMSSINILYLYTLSLLGKQIFDKIYPKYVEMRDINEG